MRLLPPRPTSLLLLAGLVGGSLSAVAATGPAAAQVAPTVGTDVSGVPADGVFTLDGHGWGHGHGLSQFGAQGAAKLGVSAETIVSTYYPGTARGVLADAPIRVQLDADESRDTVVLAGAGLTATDVATGATAVLPTGPDAWRVTVDAQGMQLSSRTGGAWSPFALTATPMVGPVRFSGLTFHRVLFPDGSARDYRGAVQAVRTGATSLESVAEMGLEDYLLGVVPRESPSTWEPAALQAQSIAARSYSAWKRARSGGAAAKWDICDTTQCQVFGGSRLVTRTGAVVELEPASTTQAIQATRGVVRTYNGEPIFAEYSSSNGGWSTNGSAPYLRAMRDDWDGVVPSAANTWKATLTVRDIELRFPELGALRGMRVVERDGNGEWGGRVRSVVLTGVTAAGTPTTVTTTGAVIYRIKPYPVVGGLRSTWWNIRPFVAAGPAAAPIAADEASASPTVDAPVVPRAPAPVALPPARRVSAQLLAVSRPVVVPRRGKATIWYDVRNTGNVAWPVKGAVRSTATRSPSRSRTWLSPTRPSAVSVNRTQPGARTVAPGQVGRINVALAGNGRTAGARADNYGLTWDGVAPIPLRVTVRYTVR